MYTKRLIIVHSVLANVYYKLAVTVCQLLQRVSYAFIVAV